MSKKEFIVEGSVKKLEKINIINISKSTVALARSAETKILIFLLFTSVSFETKRISFLISLIFFIKITLSISSLNNSNTLKEIIIYFYKY